MKEFELNPIFQLFVLSSCIFFAENPLVLHGQYAVYSILCDRYGSTEWMGLFIKTRCLHHPLCSGVSNEPFRVR